MLNAVQLLSSREVVEVVEVGRSVPHCRGSRGQCGTDRATCYHAPTCRTRCIIPPEAIPPPLLTYRLTHLQVRFLHQKRILHRDLKPENLLYKDNDPGAPLKVIDFGLAVVMEPRVMVEECCGTTSYMAPEVSW